MNLSVFSNWMLFEIDMNIVKDTSGKLTDQTSESAEGKSL